jgi:hypothetical protein
MSNSYSEEASMLQNQALAFFLGFLDGKNEKVGDSVLEDYVDS